MVATNMAELEDGFQSLSQIGISINEDFQLEMDEDILDNKLLTNVKDIGALFKSDYSSTDASLRYVSNTANTASGTYFVNIAGTDVDGNPTTANIIKAEVVTQELLYSEAMVMLSVETIMSSALAIASFLSRPSATS